MINLKNKKFGYYLVMANVLLGIILGIVFFATYKGAMANNAWGLVPETIGIFALAGAVLELVVLLLPQYSIIHVGALVMFGLSFYKEVVTIPNLIADEVNNVHYQGGSLPVNIIYVVLQVVIIAAAIYVAFTGLYNDEKEAKEDFKAIKGTQQVAKLAVGAGLVVAAVLSSTIVTSTLKANVNKANDGGTGGTSLPGDEIPAWNPITDQIRAQAEAFDYSFDPSSVVIEKEEEYDFSSDKLSKLNATASSRDGHYIVYYFEGAYSEGYQGDYSETYAYLTLWDDGLFGGKAADTSIKGYWYNRKGADEPCLEMVSNVKNYESMIAEENSGFYQRQAYIYLGMSWGGTRSIIVNGYLYSPEVALFIDAGTEGQPLNYKVGDTFDRSSWTANRVLKNLQYTSVFKQSEVKWQDEAGMLSGGKFVAAGDYTVTAKWNDLTATIPVHVTE